MNGKCQNQISRLHFDGSPWLTTFDWLMNLVAAALDHALGLLAAALVGLVAGHRIGRIYAGQVEPLYVRDLHELAAWQVIPDTFARNGAVLGAVAGLLLIVILHRKVFSQKVISRVKIGAAAPSQTTEIVEAGNERNPKVIGDPAENEKFTPEKGQPR